MSAGEMTKLGLAAVSNLVEGDASGLELPAESIEDAEFCR
jgi:hypothetical protein